MKAQQLLEKIKRWVEKRTKLVTERRMGGKLLPFIFLLLCEALTDSGGQPACGEIATSQ